MCHELSREWAMAYCSPSHSYTWQAKICSSLIVHGFCLIPRLWFFPSPHEIERWGPIFCDWPHIHCSFLLIDPSYCVHRVPSVWRMNSLYYFFPPQCTFVPSTLSVIYMTACLFHASIWRMHGAACKTLDWQWLDSALWRCYPAVSWHCFL